MSSSDSCPAEAVDPVWISSKSIQIPPADILSFVFANVGRYDKQRPIFIDANNPSSSISAEQAVRTTLRLIEGLKARGLKEGQCVLLHAFNQIWYPLIWLAVIGAGGRVVGSNPRYTKSELLHLLDLTTPTFVFAQLDCMSPILEAAAAARTKIDPSKIFVIDSPDLNIPVNITETCQSNTHSLPIHTSDEATTLVYNKEDRKRIDINEASPEIPVKILDSSKVISPQSHATPLVHGHPSWCTLLLDNAHDWPNPTRGASFDPENIAVYGMTSGTTGLPKVAMISHRAIVAQTAVLEDLFRAKPYQPSQLICLPVFHAFASPLALVLPLRLGIPTFFLPKWSPLEYLQAIETHAITDSPVCPPIVGMLTQIPLAKHAHLKSLRCVISAGAALPGTVQNRLYDILAPEAVVTQCWGTTEGGWHTCGDLLKKDHVGSIGRLMPNAQLKLVDDDGAPVTDGGKPGEALIKTATMFSGYLENSKANEEAFDSNGFYRTGDQVYMRGGNLYYSERIKDTMKVKGWQVSPTEIEDVLLQHPQIADAAVVGVTRDNMAGVPETFPTAYVVRRSGYASSPLRNEDVKAFVATRVISYKRITGDVVFVQQIPRSLAGKILRRNLAQADLDLVDETITAAMRKKAFPPEQDTWSQKIAGLVRSVVWWRI